MSRPGGALVAGATVALLVAVATTSAWRTGSPVAARAGGEPAPGAAWGFLVLLAAAFAAYVAALALVRRSSARLAAVLAVAAAVQLSPVAAPLLLSTDAWTYWSYGWTAAIADENPYRVSPRDVPGNPALPWMGRAWRGTTTVYGPGFTLASEPLSAVAGSSEDHAAWQYKLLGGVGALAAAAFAAVAARRRVLAAAFVGWNPILAVHLAGGGHNDAWVAALVAAGLALAVVRRAQAGGAAWTLAVLVKWVPVVFLALHLLDLRARRRTVPLLGIAVTAAVVLGLATQRYGAAWLTAPGALAGNAAEETSYALPARVQSLGVPHGIVLSVAAAALVAGLAWLARAAARGRARLGLAACLVLATTPYLAVWYLAWAVALAGADEDRAARIGCIVLGAYLLPQTIPL